LNPLRDILLKVIDFEALNSCKWIDLFISATNVKTGKVKVFAKEDLTPDHLLASACLPNLFQAVEIDDQFYWDGGYMGNPSLWPLFYETEVTDLLVVHINPIERPEIPRTPSEISNRVNEITFNSALLKEMRAVSFVQKLVSEGWLKDEYKDKLSNIIFHSIRAEKVFQNLSLASKYDTGWEFLTKLKSYGQEEAKLWLESNYDHVGKKSSVNLHEEFLDR
ncbi:MAG: patatin-like phospholipase family protein, partial [Pseudomonadota bacterium]